ncbi:hypothetical protein QUF80_00380 [Desulfococcaceae bacterium HSG8]|nr:hypothetical protein [Desulfococcaceae bacterium HSG8]
MEYKSLILATMFFFLPNILFSNSAYAELLIVGNHSVTINSLTGEDIKKIFLGNKIAWDGDQEIRFVIMKKSPIHKDFVKKYIHKTPSQFRRYWKKLIFTGKASPPKSYETEEEIISYVANTPGAIGYVSSDALTDKVKIITISD